MVLEQIHTKFDYYTKIFRFISGQKILILKYHRVLHSYDYMYPGEVDIETFRWQMALLAKYFNVLSTEEALSGLATNSLPSNSVCITFDDGYADNFLNALPILIEHNLPATFFVASGFLDGGRMWNDTISEAIRNLNQPILDLSVIGYDTYDIQSPEMKALTAAQIILKVKHLPQLRRDAVVDYIASLSNYLCNDLMLTTEQLVHLSHAGMEIGGHTVTHPILATLDAIAVENEVAKDKLALEGKLNKKIRYFAYPNGRAALDYSAEQVDIVRKNGYEAAFSTGWGVSNKNTDRWQLVRFSAWDKTPGKFILRLMLAYSGYR